MTHAVPARDPSRASETGDRPAFQPTTPLDMTGVDPLRRLEIRRRVAVVRSFVDLTDPTDGDRRRHAERLQLSVNQFLALVRAWRSHGTAVAISCAGAAKGSPRPSSARNLPVASKEAAERVIAELDPKTSHADAARAVAERCAALGVPAPSRSTLWNMTMARRRRAAAPSDGSGLLVSRCHLRLPVLVDGLPAFPGILLVVDLSTGVVPIAAFDAGADAAARRIAAMLERLPTLARSIVDVELAPLILRHTPRRFAAVKSSAARTATAAIVGRGIGTLDLLYQRGRSIEPAAMLKARKDAALPPIEARAVVVEQLAGHNAARGAEPAKVFGEP